jgi:ribosomal protein L40E
MICRNCGNEIPDTAKFCPKCGAKVEIEKTPEPKVQEDVVICRRCGESNPLTAKFCKKCGAPLKENVAPVLVKEGTKRLSKRWVWITTICGLILVIVGIGSYLYFSGSYEKRVETYYPLDEGRKWIYQRSFTKGPERKTGRIMVTNLAPRKLEDKIVIPRKWDFLKDETNTITYFFAFIAKDPQGIYIFATQSPKEVSPEILKTPKYIIKYPIKIGTSWEVEAQSKLLNDAPVILKVTIEAIDDIVTVPAGTFKNCLRIKGEGVIRKEELGNEIIVNIEVYEWYAPGVGFIKGIKKEKGSGRFSIPDYVEIVTQLESIKK